MLAMQLRYMYYTRTGRLSGYFFSRVLPNSVHSSSLRTFESNYRYVRFTTSCDFASHIQQSTQPRPAYDSSSQNFSISFSCRPMHPKLKRKFCLVTLPLANVCLHHWNSFSARSLSSNPTATVSSSGKPWNDDQENHTSVLHQLKRLENSLRFHGYSTIRIGVGVFIVLGLMVYVLRDPIRENVAVEVSQVASRSLEHEHVAIKAEEFAKSLLQTLLHDENMHHLAAQFVKQVLNSPETRKATADYISSILEDHQNRQLLASTIKQVLLLAIHDPETTAALKAVVVLILSDPESQKAARGLITAVFRHDDLKAAAALFFADVLKSQAVVKQATKLGKDITYNIITDPNLKEETGKSFWDAVKYSITPRWFSGTTSESSSSSSSSKPSSCSSEMHPSSSLLSQTQKMSSSSLSSSQPSSSSQQSQLSPPPPSIPSSPSSSTLPTPQLSSSHLSSPSPLLSTQSASLSKSLPSSSKLHKDLTAPSLTEEESFAQQQLLDEQLLDEDSNILT